MDKSIDLPITDCDITITVGRDGVWLHFGQYTTIHVHNTLGQDGSIISKNINKWCIERQAQAQQIRDDNGQFGVGA